MSPVVIEQESLALSSWSQKFLPHPSTPSRLQNIHPKVMDLSTFIKCKSLHTDLQLCYEHMLGEIWVYKSDGEFKISKVIISSHLPDFIPHLMGLISHRSLLLGHTCPLLCTNTTLNG